MFCARSEAILAESIGMSKLLRKEARFAMVGSELRVGARPQPPTARPSSACRRCRTGSISASLTKEERRAGRRVTAEKSRELDETRREMSEARKRDAARAGRGAPW